jgi:hypothetical protein
LVQKNLYVLGFIGHISVQRKYAPFYLKWTMLIKE